MKRNKGLVTIVCLLIVFSVIFAETLFGGDPRLANREALTRDLENFALRGQEYYHRPVQKWGGGGTFVGLTADASGLAKLTPKPINTNGTFSIATAGSATSIQLRGIGTQLGTNGSWINITILVFADSTSVTYTN